ncbi:DUF6214 family protein [Streptomyces sp. NPDC050355]|uniref:DUF6214 family protein n=1 Tax=Streptomyces sp. NPDC050355 TaxID=3365609 RepID=UPI0037A34E74
MRGHGTAAPVSEPAAPDEATGGDARGCPPPRLDPLGPWCSARLTFADGARIDVLVTVSDDHITVEDVRADPPLTPDGLAELARWIEGPLDDAFRTATGRPRKTRSAPRQPGPAATSPEPVGGVMAGSSADEPTAGPARATVTGVAHGAVTGGPAPEPPNGAAPQEESADPMPEPEPEAAYAPAPEPAGAGAEAAQGAATEESTQPAAEAPGPGEGPEERARSALLARSRAAERRRLAADAYRQAQREGRDPVLAVMLATGRNRRRSLRLIAGARDEGLLTPRHNKR